MVVDWKILLAMVVVIVVLIVVLMKTRGVDSDKIAARVVEKLKLSVKKSAAKEKEGSDWADEPAGSV